ncbi:PIN domain-containing protein [Candidatus Daviesbacteria bacterium]|nr:PIN domain-containing protein [Candidatus Daviesbacteria bacterium]
MNKRKIFVDSDVVLSSLISSKGAAYFLLNETQLDLFISNISLEELRRGLEKLQLNKKDFATLIENKMNLVKLKDLDKVKLEFRDYVFDADDAHIVAGARKAKVILVLSYNIKDFNILKLKEDLKIVVKTPAQFLQYLRSLQ